jgi:hypothetical protein
MPLSYVPRITFFLVVLWFGLREHMLVKQALYHLSHTPRPFCFSLFFKIGPASDCDPPTFASQVAGIIDVSYHAQPK